MKSHTPHGTPCGFSLAEVALALAVASLAIMTVLGLMPMLMDSERANTATSVFPAMCSQVMGKLREEAYPVTPPEETRLMYFTDQGTLTSDTSDAVYACEITHRTLPVEAARPGGANAPTPGVHCQIVQMKFRWPVGAAAADIRTFHATLAND